MIFSWFEMLKNSICISHLLYIETYWSYVMQHIERGTLQLWAFLDIQRISPMYQFQVILHQKKKTKLQKL